MIGLSALFSQIKIPPKFFSYTTPAQPVTPPAQPVTPPAQPVTIPEQPVITAPPKTSRLANVMSKFKPNKGGENTQHGGIKTSQNLSNSYGKIFDHPR